MMTPILLIFQDLDKYFHNKHAQTLLHILRVSTSQLISLISYFCYNLISFFPLFSSTIRSHTRSMFAQNIFCLIKQRLGKKQIHSKFCTHAFVQLSNDQISNMDFSAQEQWKVQKSRKSILHLLQQSQYTTFLVSSLASSARTVANKLDCVFSYLKQV